ncbi:uncharacterized protein LOC62_01G000110 [Vanrija pseudolonga]|uniref:Uncharacterized protein n=1 Tax=Vanrija pseudolonga TaxID=143232 RepID=A0AAF0Y1S4_9TREE|nr:hypothetical protein LOC62_01G000110 [Vanrija pseudolonga]
MAEFPTSFRHDDQDIYLTPRYHEDDSDDEGNIPCCDFDDFDDIYFANPETCYASAYGAASNMSKAPSKGVAPRMSFSLVHLVIALIASVWIWWIRSGYRPQVALWPHWKSSNHEAHCYSIVLLDEAQLEPLAHLVLGLHRMQTDPHQMAAYKDREAVVAAGHALVGLYKAHAAGQIIADVGGFSAPEAGAEDPFVELQRVVNK